MSRNIETCLSLVDAIFEETTIAPEHHDLINKILQQRLIFHEIPGLNDQWPETHDNEKINPFRSPNRMREIGF